MIVVTLVVVSLFGLFFRFSRLGLAMQATALDPEAALAQGVSDRLVHRLSWAIAGGLGASMYFPAMQSLIHGNFEGKMQARVFAMIGAAGAIGAAVGPLFGGFVTTLLSWRVGFLLEAGIIRQLPDMSKLADPKFIQ